MIYHRKRLILSTNVSSIERLNHLLRMKRMKTEYDISQKHMELSGDDDDHNGFTTPLFDFPL